MKTLHYAVIITLGLCVSVTGCAEEDHIGHNPAAQVDSHAAVPLVYGEVKKVDKTVGMVTLAHDKIPNIGMPAMTMSFKVKDAVWLEQMRPGDHIRFQAENVGGEFTIVHFEPGS